MQETLLRAWRHPEALDPDRGSTRAWLFTTARHLAIDAWRRRTARVGEVVTDAPAGAAGRPERGGPRRRGVDDRRGAGTTLALPPRGVGGVLLPRALGGGGGHGPRHPARDGEVPDALRGARASAGARRDGGDEVTCRFALDDGAYVLGALSPAERAEFEQHLASAPRAASRWPPRRAARAAWSARPGHRGAVGHGAAHSAAPGPRRGHQPDAGPSGAGAPGPRSRPASPRSWSRSCRASACTWSSAPTATPADRRHTARCSRPRRASRSRPTSRSPPPTAARGSPCAAGTAGAYEGRSWPVWLVVFPRDGGQTEQIGSWMATPGQEVTLTALTHYRPDQIARVELQGSDQRTLALVDRPLTAWRRSLDQTSGELDVARRWHP